VIFVRPVHPKLTYYQGDRSLKFTIKEDHTKRYK